MEERRYAPIADYALLSDCHSAALVSTEGSVDWACFRRFDAPSTFARLLDHDRGGYCSLAPVDGRAAGRGYVGDTLIVRTAFRTPRGAGTVTDFLSISSRSDPEDPRDVHPHHQLIRIAETTEGTVDWELVCRPRYEYGVVTPLAELTGERRARLTGGPDAISVDASVPLEIGNGEVSARFRLDSGARAWFVLTGHRAHDLASEDVTDDVVTQRLNATLGFWEEWATQCAYDGPYRPAVLRSALTLKALTNAPTGAIVAAPTTSLPERIGGTRNWDYRYCWVRDGTFTLYALFELGLTDEAGEFLRWLTRTTAGRPTDLQVLYGVGGERHLPEVELDHLEGYRASRPVRVGNGAAVQFQLDIFGEILDTAHQWRKHGGMIEPAFWDFLRGCVGEIERRWRDPDEGIWEVRRGPAHFVYSKAMCWVGVDRAVRAAEALGLDAPLDAWRALRDEIREAILTKGVDARSGSFIQAFDRPALDASLLLLPLIGFVSPSDPRMVATVEAVRRNLTTEGVVHRYLNDDGILGDEGAFTMCSFWLVDNLAIQGRAGEAHELFDHLCSFANDVGLFSEQVDPRSGEMLGNFPQGFTHLALISSALNLRRAEAGPAEARPRPMD